MYKMSDINQAPANFMAKTKNNTINMLDNMMFNLDQLKVENYVERKPKFLFKAEENRLL